MKSAAMRKANAEHEAETAHGRKYGYRIQKSSENAFGHRSCGLANCPPIKGLFALEVLSYHVTRMARRTYATVAPTDQTTGIKANT